MKDSDLVSVYKKLICDMIQSLEDERFLRQMYSIIYRHKQRREGNG